MDLGSGLITETSNKSSPILRPGLKGAGFTVGFLRRMLAIAELLPKPGMNYSGEWGIPHRLTSPLEFTIFDKTSTFDLGDCGTSQKVLAKTPSRLGRNSYSQHPKSKNISNTQGEPRKPHTRKQ